MTVGGSAILLVVICILALFSALETALFSLKPHQLRRLQEQHASLSNFVQVFRAYPRRVLTGLLLGDSLVKVPLILLCLLLSWEAPLPTPLPYWLIALGIFAIIVLLCDLIPKLLAISVPYRLSTVGAFTLQTLLPVLERMGRR